MKSNKRERHQAMQEVVDGLLAGDPTLASIAEQAERQGVSRHDVRQALGQAFLFGYWQVSAGVRYGPKRTPGLLASWFRKELADPGCLLDREAVPCEGP